MPPDSDRATVITFDPNAVTRRWRNRLDGLRADVAAAEAQLAEVNQQLDVAHADLHLARVRAAVLTAAHQHSHDPAAVLVVLEHDQDLADLDPTDADRAVTDLVAAKAYLHKEHAQ